MTTTTELTAFLYERSDGTAAIYLVDFDACMEAIVRHAVGFDCLDDARNDLAYMVIGPQDLSDWGLGNLRLHANDAVASGSAQSAMDHVEQAYFRDKHPEDVPGRDCTWHAELRDVATVEVSKFMNLTGYC